MLGILTGFWLGYCLVTRMIGYSSGLGANDIAGVVCAGVLGAVLIGAVGKWVGEGLVSRLSGAA